GHCRACRRSMAQAGDRRRCRPVGWRERCRGAGVELLRDINTEFSRSVWPAMITKKLMTTLCSDEERPWATWNKGKPISDRQLAKLLGQFDIISETVHPHETGELKDAKGYKLARFADARERYLTPWCQTGGSQASWRPNADEMGTNSDFCSRPE